VLSVEREYEGATLPDFRLQRRLGELVRVLQTRPEASFPELFGNESQLEGLYRFTNNRRVAASDILAGHRAKTIERCAGADYVLAVHDSSEFCFSGERADMYPLRDKHSGFLGHFTLAVSADGSRRPLGLLRYETVRRQRRPKGANWKDNFNDPNKESLRWGAGARAASEQLGAERVIHVMDREADSYELFCQLQALNTRYVVRLAHNRRITGVDPEDPMVIEDALGPAPVRSRRSVPLSGRAAKAAPVARAKHPPRVERDADLEIVSCEVRLARPHHIQNEVEELPVNIVHVREPNPPEGEEPVDWRIVTNLPVSTPAELERVVDAYRARWLIEEFFKALKTGCAFMERQQTSLAALERTLALSIPIAWGLLAIRWASRNEPEAPASTVLTPSQLECLHALRPKMPVQTAQNVYMAVASLGGHLKSNGPPGWQVLARGYQRLRDMDEGYQRALQAVREKATHRSAIRGSDRC
jgi:hypothetical protein